MKLFRNHGKPRNADVAHEHFKNFVFVHLFVNSEKELSQSCGFARASPHKRRKVFASAEGASGEK